MLNRSLRKALVARKAAFSSRTFICCLASRGEQRPFAVEPWHQAPQPALEASEVMHRSGAGVLIGLSFMVGTFWYHHCSSA